MRQDPIVIVPYDPEWPQAFERERNRIEAALRPWLARPVEHIGSTSVPGLAAKAIIDMVAVVRDIDEIQQAAALLERLGWLRTAELGEAEGRVRSFCTPTVANRTHHLHVVEESSERWRGWLAFRDYLGTHPGLASGYASLKSDLAARHGADPNQRGPYRAGKAAFIQEVTEIALADQLAHKTSGRKSRVEIEYCTRCRWLPRAAWLAQELLGTFEDDLGHVALVPGSGGAFVVRADAVVVWDRKVDGFPEPSAVKRRVRDGVAPGKELGHADR
jgi:selT/selW/selH-like putative selenoprotein